MKVKDVMTTGVVSVKPGTSLKRAAEMLVEARVSGLPVVDDEGAVVGVFSEGDVLVKEAGDRGTRGGLLSWLFEASFTDVAAKLAARTVGEAMSAPPLTIGPERPLHEAATRMIESSVNRLPVVADGKLVGIVTRADLVRAFARSDADIEREIVEEIIRRTLWIAPDAVQVSVEGGEVTLRGRVETQTDAELLPVFVERVAGVVSVRSELLVAEPTPTR